MSNNETKRAVLYARVSGDDRGNEGRNLTGQLDMCRNYVEKYGYTTVAELAEDDRGASGADFDLPGLGEALEMAAASQFDVLIVRELDRFARGLAKQLIVEQKFKNSGVDIEYVLGEYPDTPEGNLNKNIKAVIAEFERLKINERMVRGRRQKVRAGSVIVSDRPPFGYDVVKHENGRHELTIKSEEAEIVRMIFEWYTHGDNADGPLSMNAITKKLTALRIPSPSEGKGISRKVGKKRGRGNWSETAVDRILKRETYRGVWHYGKISKKGKKRVRNETDLIAVEVPTIIDAHKWERAQKQRRLNRRAVGGKVTNEYLLRRHISCGHCGAKMVATTMRPRGGKKYSYYACYVKHGQTRYTFNCDGPTGFQRVEYVDAHVWAWVKTFLMDPSAMRDGLQGMQDDRETELAPLYRRLAVIDEILANNGDQLERLLDLYLSGDVERLYLIDKKQQLESTIEAMEGERAAVMAQTDAQFIQADHLKIIEARAAELRDELDNTEHDFKAQRRLIELLDVRVALTKVAGEIEARAECVLGVDVLPVTPASDLRDRSRQTEQSGQGRDRQMQGSVLCETLPPTR